MKILKQYRIALVILIPVLILVIIRSVSTNHFKPDAKKLAEPSVMRSNLVSKTDMATLSGNILLINMDESKADIEIGNETEVMNITPDNILEKSAFNMIAGHKGPVVLFSSDISIASRMWMFLSQMGIKNLYILTNDKDNESFKNKFRPETFIRPEL